MAVKINYQNINFDELLDDLKAFLITKETFVDADFEGSHIATLLELMTYTSTLLSFYVNASANECFIETAELYESVNRLSELVGFFPRGFRSATVDIELELDLNQTLSGTSFTSGEVLAGNWFVEVPPFSQFKALDTTFEGEVVLYTNPKTAGLLLTQEKFDNDNLKMVIPLVQGVSKNVLFTSDGSDFQKFILENFFLDEANLQVFVDGVEWTRRDNFFDRVTGTSEVYVARVNQNAQIELQFGDDLFGKVPPATSEISVFFLESLGSKGKIRRGQLGDGTGSFDPIQTSIILFNQFNPGQQIVASFITDQNSASAGGSDIETIEEVREHSPQFFRIQGRVVTDRDYEDFIEIEFDDEIADSKVFNFEEAITQGLIEEPEVDRFTSEVFQTSGWTFNAGAFALTPSVSATSGDLAKLTGAIVEDLNDDGTDFTFTDWLKFDAAATSGGNYTQTLALPVDFFTDEAVYLMKSKINADLDPSDDFSYVVDNSIIPTRFESFTTLSGVTSSGVNDTSHVATGVLLAPVSGSLLARKPKSGTFGIKITSGSTVYVEDLEIIQPVETARFFFNDIFIFIVPAGDTIIAQNGNIVNQSFINLFESTIEKLKMLTVRHIFREPAFVTFDTDVRFTKDATKIFTSSTVLINQIQQIIGNFFDKSNRKIGDTISFSELITLIKAIEGIDTVRLTITTSPVLPGENLFGDIELTDIQFPILGTTTIAEGSV